MNKIENAKIGSTMLGVEDHGILTAFLHLDFDGTCQGFGGYGLDDYDKARKVRIPTDACGKWVKGICEVLGVDRWENLPGKYLRVEREDKWNGKILKIGHIIKDQWFDPIKN